MCVWRPPQKSFCTGEKSSAGLVALELARTWSPWRYELAGGFTERAGVAYVDFHPGQPGSNHNVQHGDANWEDEGSHICQCGDTAWEVVFSTLSDTQAFDCQSSYSSSTGVGDEDLGADISAQTHPNPPLDKYPSLARVARNSLKISR